MKSVLSLALLAALVAACGRSVDMYPIGTGTGGTGGSTSADAATQDSTGGGSTINGRVCLISDARSPLTCASSGAADLTVKLGAATATTAADGSFTIAAASATNLVWRVTGTDIKAAAMQQSTVATIPALSTALYEDMVAANQAVTDGGAVIARITSGGSGVSGLVATATPAPPVIYYDGTSATEWEETATGSFGVVWAPGLAAGTAQLVMSDTQATTISGIPVYADTITFAFAELQ